MPTTISHTIDVGGTGDYTTLQAWETAQQRDLVAADEIAKAVCINTGTSADATVCAITGWTTDATRYCWVTGESEPHGGKWNTSTYYMQLSFSAYVLQVAQAYTIVEFIQLNNTNNNGEGIELSGTSTGSTLNALIVRTTGTGNGSYGIFHGGTASNVWIRNCLVYDFANTVGIQGRGTAGSGDKIYNCTVQNCATGYTVVTGTTTVISNCIAQDCTTDFSGTWHANSNNNLDEDGTAPGASSVTATLTFVDKANDDFHLAAGDTGAIDAGADLTGDADNPVDFDIDGTARPQGSATDIGMDERISAAAARRIFVVS